MKRVVFAVIAVLFVASLPALAQNSQPACTVAYDDLPSDVRTATRSLDERVQNLKDAIDRVVSDVSMNAIIDELTYWAVMADLSREESEIEYPDCQEYTRLVRTFDDIVEDVYALSSQSILVLRDELTPTQRERVGKLFADQFDVLNINLALWQLTYEQIVGA